MLYEAIAGAIMIACVAISIHLLTRPGEPVSITKTAEGGQYIIRIRANKGLASVAVGETQDQGDLILKRAGLKKGDVVEFQVPVSLAALMVLVEDERGTRAFEC